MLPSSNLKLPILAVRSVSRPEKFRTEADSNPDRCDVGEVLDKLNYQPRWRLSRFVSLKK